MIKRLFLWLVGVVLGVALFLAAVMGTSYAFTKPSSLPSASLSFAEVELQPNHYCWHIPLLGGVVDKVFYSSSSLSIQKLDTISVAHPNLVLPDWATYATLSIAKSSGETVFEGDAAQYEAFLYPENGEYTAEIILWRLPTGMSITEFTGGNDSSLSLNAGLEQPAKPTGYYSYTTRFSIQASADITFSSDRMEQGGTIGAMITGMVGTSVPIVTTALGNIQCVRCTGGWVCYIPAAYNANAGKHTVSFTVNGQTLERFLTVTARNFGTAEVAPEEQPTDATRKEFQNAIWPLYELAATPRCWTGAWSYPVEDYVILVNYGEVKMTNGTAGSRSNSTLLQTVVGQPVTAPMNGTVLLAKHLALTGNTIVIDHGCGLRSYFYGLSELTVAKGQEVRTGQAIGPAGEQLTMDFKLGKKSISPWFLFQGSGGLFWRMNETRQV